MKTNLVGLDIGSSGVRAVELRVGGKTKPEILHSHEISLPLGAVARGEILDASTIRDAVHQLWAEGGFKNKKVVIGTGNQSVLVRELNLPKMPLKHLRESLPFHVQNILQLPLNEALLDFYPTSESSGEKGPVINGLLIAAEKKGILEKIKVVEGAGLMVLEVELSAFALNRVIINRPGTMGTVALIDIGASTTSIVVSTNGEPSFVRIISGGGNDVTLALQEELGIGAGSAESLKRSLKYQFQERGEAEKFPQQIQSASELSLVGPPLVPDFRATKIIRNVTDELLSGLRSTVTYFNNLHSQNPILQIVLTGGGSQLPGIARALSQITNLPIKSIDPLSSFSLPPKKIPKKFTVDVTMTTALGLALRSAS